MNAAVKSQPSTSDPDQSPGQADLPLRFSFEGQDYTGLPSDTVASALYRSGVRVFSRSFKYHRPRGLSCLSGACSHCLVNVDGAPNLRACMTPLREGMRVVSQNAWPSLKQDWMGALNRLDRFLPVGFYYKTFIRPRRLWPLYERLLRNAAGLGRIDLQAGHEESSPYDKQYLHAQVAVVGGGPAGLCAALEAANAGARVALIDENPALGGRLRYTTRHVTGDLRHVLGAAQNPHDYQELGLRLAQAAREHPLIQVLTGATAFGWYQDNYVGIVQGNRLVKLRAQQLIVATGAIQQPLAFKNNDLPGVFLSSGLQRLVALHGLSPGERVLIFAGERDGWLAAEELVQAGVQVVAVVDPRPAPPSPETAAIFQAAGSDLYSGYALQRALGTEDVRGAVVRPLDPQGRPLPGAGVEIACDAIGVANGSAPNNALLFQSGCQMRCQDETGDYLPEAYTPGVLAAGRVLARRSLRAVLLEGRMAGLRAALALESLEPAVQSAAEASLRDLEGLWSEAASGETAAHPGAFPLAFGLGEGDGRKNFICSCEDVTLKDLRHAIAEGFSDIQTLKRYSTVTMGPCQGKMCALNTRRVCAHHSGRSLAETGRTTSRPPFVPVKLGVLAGRKLSPVRHTPMHERHLTLGAVMMDAGQWKRPEHYGDPQAEVRAVRERVGLIDVSTLGKLDVCGPQAAELLDRIYTTRVADLPVGRLRYGLMCTEEGVILDDGVVCRLAEDHFYLTTSSGGLQTVYEWIEWWRVSWGYQAYVTDLTDAFAALNLAGPQARQVLSGLTPISLKKDDFPYLHFREGKVDGLPARLLRVGFVGELGYEIHYPANSGAALWDNLLDAGAEAGIGPFGIEAQRVLRLEKKHLIVGQDTDALSTPYGAGLGWAVKLAKDDFLGKRALAHSDDPQELLVGFEMDDPRRAPLEGEQIRERGRFIGRVTSARFSPTLEKAIGMAWVPADKAQPGAVLHMRLDGRRARARVTAGPFYDPDGERLRG